MSETPPPERVFRLDRWHRVTLLWVVAATIIAVAGVAAMWHQARPGSGGICPAIYPAPPGCAHEARTPVAILWTVILAVGYAGTVAAAVTARRRWWLPAVALLLLAAAAMWGHSEVVYA